MRAALISICAFIACGCASVAQPDAPAVIVGPTAETRAELHGAVTTALNRSDVTLAEDALTRDSMLVIERTPARDAAGTRLSGRDLDKPEQFQLLLSDGRCVLLHARTAQRYELPRTRCAAKPK